MNTCSCDECSGKENRYDCSELQDCERCGKALCHGHYDEGDHYCSRGFEEYYGY